MAIEERVMVLVCSCWYSLQIWEKAQIEQIEEESRGRRRGSASSREGSGD